MHIRQKKRSKTCGQLSLAVMIGITPEQAVRLVGHQRGTKGPELIRAASRCGWISKTKTWNLVDSEDSYGVVAHVQRGIARVTRAKRRNWHWVAIVDGIIYDPAASSVGVLCDPRNKISAYIEFENTKQ